MCIMEDKVGAVQPRGTVNGLKGISFFKKKKVFRVLIKLLLMSLPLEQRNAAATKRECCVDDEGGRQRL